MFGWIARLEDSEVLTFCPDTIGRFDTVGRSDTLGLLQRYQRANSLPIGNRTIATQPALFRP